MIEMPKIKLEGYCIYNPETGKFSAGGRNHPIRDWGRNKPKIWSSIRNLNLHLAQFINYRNDQKNLIMEVMPNYTIYENCIVFDVVNQIDIGTVEDFLTKRAEARGKKLLKSRNARHAVGTYDGYSVEIMRK